MIKLTVLEYPHKALRTICSPVVQFDDAFRELIKNCFEILLAEDAVGLAANQVGILSRFFVMNAVSSSEHDNLICLVNPVIMDAIGETTLEEGCLSLPHASFKVKRALEIQVQYQDEFGTHFCKTFSGLEAHCIQHETDHLNGILSIDKLSALKRQLYVKKLEKQQRRVS